MAGLTPPAPVYVCPICGAMANGSPPHGSKQPCPQKVAIDDAYIENLRAQAANMQISPDQAEMMTKATLLLERLLHRSEDE